MEVFTSYLYSIISNVALSASDIPKVEGSLSEVPSVGSGTSVVDSSWVDMCTIIN